MSKFWNAIRTWLDNLRMDLALLDIEHEHRKAGSDNPYLAARQELFIRAEILERFRDDASRMFLKGEPLEKFKETWIKENLSAKRTVLDSATTGKVRAIIRAMPADEALHGEALAKHEQEFKEWMDGIRAINKKANGPTGLTPRMQRVLRGRG